MTSVNSNLSESMSTKNLTKDQLQTAKEVYANMIIDGMDLDTLCQFVYDTMMGNMEEWDEVDLKEEVTFLYDDETWENVTEGEIPVYYGEEMKPAS